MDLINMKKVCFTSLVLVLLVATACAQQPPPARLIVRGDDMGYSHAGNEAMILAWKKGIERSVEIIVPSPWFPEAVKMLQENPGIDVGIHLAITSEWDNIKWRPVSDCRSLRDSDGYFYPMVRPNKNYPGRAILENKWTLADIEKEFRAQIELALKKLPRISHISGHMGCTYINNEVTAMTKKLAQEYKIDIDLEALGVQYAGYNGPHGTLQEKIKSFIAMLDKLEPGKTYMFLDHPGLDSPELRAIHHIGYENVAADRQGVTDLFTSEQVKAAIATRKIQLVSYKEVGSH
jgi:predicted glycoside hydrolase/deacetylase ChbG (UPF0249 family)